MTTHSKILRFTDSASWFRRTVAQLGAALKRLPPHRRYRALTKLESVGTNRPEAPPAR